MIEQLSDSVLLEAYKKAKQNQLEEDFLAILEQELMRRDIHMNELNR
ncbi:MULTISPECIES: sporulation histidine kinase inhibitor Sda [Shouchella]|uniref:Sporulation histidine kinase inhibitor Sda n=2 Tax=Shouchella TaxID=2893057 RepID=A0ABY7W429_9BACI|nr:MULTISPECIES: sporulation histidine kinase inhibitor Sda [Shouchella]MED4129925.1 sporulation histidine kinase inhibitor Sda [Shouchella miscanthi]WDF03189.1 sporulation histidine kinase inhibitor Sda [Shouchella hunanensis]